MQIRPESSHKLLLHTQYLVSIEPALGITHQCGLQRWRQQMGELDWSTQANMLSKGLYELTSLIARFSKILDASNKDAIATTWKRCLVIFFWEVIRYRSEYDRATMAVVLGGDSLGEKYGRTATIELCSFERTVILQTHLMLLASIGLFYISNPCSKKQALLLFGWYQLQYQDHVYTSMLIRKQSYIFSLLRARWIGFVFGQWHINWWMLCHQTNNGNRI